MIDEQQDRERAGRDQGRSREAHWQVAEAGAVKEEERLSEADRRSGDQQEDWENEGGAPLPRLSRTGRYSSNA
jgi:hypothetical protein